MIFIVEKFDNEKYEYRHPIELGHDKSNFIFIPMSVVNNYSFTTHRVALFAYLSMYKGLNSKTLFSIPRFVEWAGFKSDTHNGAINDKILDVMNKFEMDGYLTCCDSIKKSNTTEIYLDSLFIKEKCENDFAILYIDEIEKIMHYKYQNRKDAYLNSSAVLLVFAFLRRKIFRRSNYLKPEERSPEFMNERRQRCPEAYAENYKKIAYTLSIGERTVSHAIHILEELKLIVSAEAWHPRMPDGTFRTSYLMFANYEKREDKYLLDYGLKYAHREMELKEKEIQKYTKEYRLKKEWRSTS